MPIPAKVFLPQPFANNAGAPYKNTIPDTSGDPSIASYNLGFPPLTMQEEISGGKPPLGQDFNGILNALSTHVFAQQAGQLYNYSSAVSTAIGGYPVGTMLESTDGVTVWFNVAAANTSDPDANGAGWVPMFNYGYTTKAGLTGGVVTLTRLEARRGVIILSGTLASNLAIVLPNTLATWLIVNTTTGAFTTTVRTAAGTGVAVPQGGFPAPTGVYGDGTNIYFSVAPVSLPIDQAPNPLTIAQRTNAGYLLATYFNQNSGLENPTIGAIFVQNSGADGYLRKISITNFEAQLFLQNLSGLLLASQVPLLQNLNGAITASQMPALSGITGSVTPGQVPLGAITQFFSISFSDPGYVTLPNGLMMQWGSVFVGNYPAGINNLPLSFPVVFPNAVLSIMTTAKDTVQCNTFTSFKDESTSGFTYVYQEAGASVQNATLYWRAIGF